MSEAFHIISDGSCDLPMELTKEKDITVVPFYVSFEEGKYQKEMIEIGVREFYQEMVDHPDVYPKSSMPSVQDYVDAFLPYIHALVSPEHSLVLNLGNQHRPLVVDNLHIEFTIR